MDDRTEYLVGDAVQLVASASGTFPFPEEGLLERWLAAAEEGDVVAYLRIVAVGLRSVAPTTHAQADAVNRCRQAAARIEPLFRLKRWYNEGKAEVIDVVRTEEEADGTTTQTLDGVEGKLHGWQPPQVEE